VRFGDPDLVGALRGAQRGALARLVPEFGSDAERVADPGTERMLLLEGATELFAAASQQSAVVVVLDDLHWADTASLQLLRHVIGSTTAMRLTIVCTYRDTDLSRGDPLNKLLADMHREATVTRIALGGLEDVELVELITAAAGHDLDDQAVGLAHAVGRETDGNPFFTAEILRHLGETGGIVLGDDGRWTIAGELDELGLPSSVRDVVSRRVERLGDEALRVLGLAAVIGREFDIMLLAQLADVGEDPLLDLMDTAVSAAVLVESGTVDRYRFAHALIQRSLYDQISPVRRARAHQRVAETLETQATTEDAAMLGELAHHWVAATRPADVDKAVAYSRRAGDAALDALAPDDAIRWYQQALELNDQQLAPDRPRRALLLAMLGSAQRQAGNPGYRDTLLEAATLAEQLGDIDTLVRAALGFPVTGESMFSDDDAKRLAASALNRVGASPSRVRARLLAVLAGAHDASLEWEIRRELSLQAVDSARQGDDDATFVQVINTTRFALTTPDRLEQDIEDLEHTNRLADRIGDPALRCHARYWLVAARYQQCDLAGADAAIAEMEDIVERVGLPHQRFELAEHVFGRLLLAADLDRAEAAGERILELGTAAGAPDALGAYGGALHNLRWHQGRLDEIADFFLDVARDNPSIAALRAVIPMLLCEVGRTDEGRERLTAEEATDFEYPYESTWLNGMYNFLDAAASTGSTTAARTLIDRVSLHHTKVATAGPFLVHGAIARPLARAATILGEYEQAEYWFAIAHDIHRRLQAPFWTALGQLDHADLCLTRRADGDVERARELVTTAVATAAEYGCAGLTKRAAELLADL